MSIPSEIADKWAEWLLESVACATQNRALLRNDPAEDRSLTEAILVNGRKAILEAIVDATGLLP